jgi:hypothetical protein
MVVFCFKVTGIEPLLVLTEPTNKKIHSVIKVLMHLLIAIILVISLIYEVNIMFKLWHQHIIYNLFTNWTMVLACSYKNMNMPSYLT